MENCESLDKLLPGYVVLADRGFNIHDSVGLMCAEVKLPAATRGKKQLSKMDVNTSRQLARVWISGGSRGAGAPAPPPLAWTKIFCTSSSSIIYHYYYYIIRGSAYEPNALTVCVTVLFSLKSVRQ